MGRAQTTGSGAAMLGILLLAVFFAANVKAEGIRLEAGAGQCSHKLAPDASWSYREWGNYETKMDLSPTCYQLGLLWLPYELDGVKLGGRFGYTELGTITADNTYPVDEPAYFRAKDTRTSVQSATARFHGDGRSKGFTLGLAAETRAFGLDLGAEVGLALLRSTWHVDAPHMATTAHCRRDWACADGNQITPYFGVNARWKYLFVSLRQYTSVHASNSGPGIEALFIGPTDGAVTQVTIGASVPL